jgi:hypothetical protein
VAGQRRGLFFLGGGELLSEFGVGGVSLAGALGGLGDVAWRGRAAYRSSPGGFDGVNYRTTWDKR